jgi:hypothetical protein
MGHPVRMRDIINRRNHGSDRDCGDETPALGADLADAFYFKFEFFDA